MRKKLYAVILNLLFGFGFGFGLSWASRSHLITVLAASLRQRPGLGIRQIPRHLLEPSIMKKERLIEMFSEMVVKKKSSLISHYYHPSFVLETNGQLQDYANFAQGHERVYKSPISYEVRYDEKAWVESGDKLAARIWITTRRPAEAATEIQVVLIATYVGDKISHLLELTWPDWTGLKAFENYGSTDAADQAP